VDIDRWHRVSRDRIKSATPFSLYEDQVLTGWPVHVIKGGRLVIRDGEWIADPPPSQVLVNRGNYSKGEIRALR
jgi:dihydroorotase-like cyclic amidohydrolase